ncbi:MAG TPA: hypothetical protein VFI47_08735 [Acidimicrobiales bacterium]|nr:hypothetical protein [Acidimicrobiales bacterium]
MGTIVRCTAVAGLCLATLACGEGDDARTGSDGRHGASGATPFLVDAVPPGFRLATAGRGTGSQEWGEDSSGTDEPFTVLAPPGEDATSPSAVIVSVTGFEGYEGGLDQASAAYGPDEQEFEVDGRRAIYSPPVPARDGEPPRWADLVVVRGDDLAVRVTTADAGRDELVDIARRAVPDDDHARAPAVPDAPDGLEVVGSVDAGVVISLSPYVQPDSDQVPGLDSGLSAGWLAGDVSATSSGPGPEVTVVGPAGVAAPAVGGPEADAAAEPTPLVVTAYPGDAADLDALPLVRRVFHREDVTLTSTTVAGRPAVLAETIDVEYDNVHRAVLTHAAWGDLVMASSRGPSATVPTADQLVAMVASVRQATPEEWDAFVVEATGGPGLHPDDGAVELERGTVAGTRGDVDWLLQARPGALDACLKLSTRERACALGGGASTIDAAGRTTSMGSGGGDPDQDGGIPEFLVATIGVPGARLRVTTPSATAEGPLHRVPGADLWGGVVFADGLGTMATMCPGYPEPPEHMTPVTVEVVDDAGVVAGCVGVGGDVLPP